MTSLLEELLEAGNDLDQRPHKSGERNEEGMRDEDKMALCSWQTGHILIYKKINKEIGYTAYHCRICPKCREKQAEKQAEKFSNAERKVKESAPDGHWRKKRVEANSKEAKALKRKAARTQGSRYVTLPCEQEGMDEILVWVDDNDSTEEELEKSWGDRTDNPTQNTDWKYVNRENRENNKKMSYGGGANPNKAVAPPSEEKEKDEDEEIITVVIPQAIIPEEHKSEAIDVFYKTNFLNLSHDRHEVQNAIFREFKYILDECKKIGIEIKAAKNQYLKMTEKEMVNQWNEGVGRMMSLLDTNVVDGIVPKNDIAEKFYVSQDLMLLENWHVKRLDIGTSVPIYG